MPADAGVTFLNMWRAAYRALYFHLVLSGLQIESRFSAEIIFRLKFSLAKPTIALRCASFACAPASSATSTLTLQNTLRNPFDDSDSEAIRCV